MRLKVVLEPSDEGGYTVYVPILPGCISEGETKAEALSSVKEAIELYLEPIEDDEIVSERAEVADKGRDISPMLLRQIARDVGVTVEELLDT